MKKITIMLTIVLVFSQFCYLSNFVTSATVEEIIGVPTVDELSFNHTVDVNIVFLGFDGYGIDTNYWDQELFDWYRPLASKTGDLFPMFYNYEYNYLLADSSTTNAFFTYLDSIVFVQPSPVPSYLEDWGFSSGSYIYGVSAADIEFWLASQFNHLPGYTLVLINSLEYIPYWYSYTVDFTDPDLGTSQYEGYMNCFAGNNSLAFYDYSTPPSNYGEGFGFGMANNVTYVPTIYETWNGTHYDSNIINDDLVTLTQYTCELVFTPSYLYHPKPYDNYVFYYLLIDCTSDDYAYNNPFEFINTSIVRASYNYLLPTANIDYQFNKARLSDNSVLETAVNNYYDDYGSYGILRADVGGINDLVENYWISYGNETTKVLPAIYFVFDKTTWYNNQYVVASAHGKDGEGWEIVGTVDKFRSTGGTTALSTHEAGHFVGLRHPHDGWSWKTYIETGNGLIDYWLWDYQASTMTYAYDFPYFNKMNKMQLYRGQMLEMLNESYVNIVIACQTLHDRGFKETPAEFAYELFDLITYFASVNSALNVYDYQTAFACAKLAALSSRVLVELAETLAVIPEYSLNLLLVFTTMSVICLIQVVKRRNPKIIER